MTIRRIDNVLAGEGVEREDECPPQNSGKVIVFQRINGDGSLSVLLTDVSMPPPEGQGWVPIPISETPDCSLSELGDFTEPQIVTFSDT